MAVFTEQDLGIMSNPLDILNEATFVDEAEIISPATVPMVENSAIGGIVVRFKDVESISESYGLDYIDSALLIAEQNNIDPAYMAVAIDEADIILDPDIVQEIGNVVVIPQSPYSVEYIVTEAYIDAFIESGDEGYLYAIFNEADDPRNNIGDAISAGMTGLNNFLGKARDTITRGKRILTGDHAALQRERNAAEAKLGRAAAERYDTYKNNAYDLYGDEKDNNYQKALKDEDRAYKDQKLAMKVQDAKDFAGKHSTALKVGAGVAAAGALAYKNKDAIGGFIDKLKAKFSKNPQGTGAKILAAVNQKTAQIANQAKSATGQNKGFFQKILDKLKAFAAWIQQKLASLKNKIMG